MQTQCSEHQTCVTAAMQLIKYEYIYDLLNSPRSLFEFGPASLAYGNTMEPPAAPKCHVQIRFDSVQLMVANRPVNEALYTADEVNLHANTW